MWYAVNLCYNVKDDEQPNKDMDETAIKKGENATKCAKYAP